MDCSGLSWINSSFFIVYLALPRRPRDRIEYTDRAKTEKRILEAGEFAVVAGTPWAAQAGYDVLAAAGNAADAAAAALLTLNVTHGEAASFPGVAPLMYYNVVTGEVKSYIGAGKAPVAASIEKFTAKGFKTVPELHIWSQLIPASPDVMLNLLIDYGTMSFGELVRPAVKLAREEALRAVRDYFYTGPIAGKIAAYHEKKGGLITYDDLASYTGGWEEPVTWRYVNYTLYANGTWSQGIMESLILQILEGIDLKALGHNCPPTFIRLTRQSSWLWRTGTPISPTRPSPMCPWKPYSRLSMLPPAGRP